MVDPFSESLILSDPGDTVLSGEKSKITNCIIGKNSKIGKNCQINGAFIADGVVLPDGTIFESEVIIGSDVTYPIELSFPTNSAICSMEVDNEEFDKISSKKENSVHIWNMFNGGPFWTKSGASKKNGNSSNDSDEDDDDDIDDEEDEMNGGFADNSTRQFYDEVFESMKGIQTMENQQMSNLILEINSSKLACNVTMDEVAKNVFAAFMELPGNEELKNLLQMVKKWRGLFLNYYKATDESLAAKAPAQRKLEVELKRKCQIQLLLAIEDKYDKEPEVFGPKVAKLVHFLYNDADVLDEEAISEWAGSIPSESKLKNIMQPVVDWLEQDDEDDEEEESDAE
ncbi:unnamed protein product [Caenorhabditis bovis]|uniref:W2 domain-containing protein n=1 Tax=Caenorhabditis bovis TaxID=2654633 RepID=A0A8S1F5J4_9PELO|nr:unnamed protein product [Caenorhabditis bovis]